jgi:hypothetical protein
MAKKQSISVLFIGVPLLAALLWLFNTDYGTIVFKRIVTLNHFVVDGNNGWLFYRGDLDYALLPWTSAAKNLVAIDSMAKQNGVTLIIVPIPNKIDLYPERLDEKLKGFPYLKNKSTSFMSRLKQSNVAILDLFGRFQKAKDSAALYDPDETHVTSSGIKIAAEETVKKFFPSYFSGVPPCLAEKEITFLGNLAEKKNDNSTKREIDIYFNACDKESAPVLKDTILIVGDSYCNYLEQYRGSYRDLLESHLGGRYLFQMYSKVNSGFKLSEKIQSFIEKKPRHKIIIWLFTAREFYKPLRVK